MHYWEECGEFFREFRRHFHTTGSVLPSSRFLAKAMVSELGKPREPCRVLEVGPGTGAVTREIVRGLRPDDRLDVVEINERFVALLRRRLEQEWRADGRVNLIHAPVEEVAGESVYDFIVSGLPLNNFPVAQVETIFRTFARLLKPGGTLTYFEYLLVRRLKAPFVRRPERERLEGVGRVVGGFIRDYEVRRERVLANVPPALVRHLRLKPATA